ncbi:cytochrome P450 [Saccharothrix longispora]|uniref:cytochrome P450 n=1 Tax=Saccharothrix longispora TaxID=33920 RepID=UPI0028FDAD18|nr:cytochrome P450 [Saccharothrix longispora]MDU0288236.1 cytochrome P450 [Saccharothrix longispora]
MPSTVKNATLLLLGRAAVRAHALLGDPAARVVGMGRTHDPYAEYERVRRAGVLVRSRLGLHLTASHEVCSSLLRDPGFGVLPPNALAPVDSTAHAGGRRLVNPVEESFLVRNPPDHTRLRRLVTPWFTPRGLRAQAATVERVVHAHLDEVAARGTFDLVGDFAARVPIQVITELLGVPNADHASFARWGSALVNAIDGVRDMGEMRALHTALREFDAFLDDLIAFRRREPGDDAVSALVSREDLSREDLVATTGLLLVAGFETTVNLIGNAVLAVLGDPAVRERLVADPSHADAVVEETLRTDPPVQYTVRVPTESTVIAGTRVPAGTPVMLLLAGANRDPAVFADPHRFDPDRADVREHLAFSSGIHYCLGAGLARMEAAAALRGLFTRFPDLRPAGRVRRRPSRVIRGAAHFPVTTGAVPAHATHRHPIVEITG